MFVDLNTKAMPDSCSPRTDWPGLTMRRAGLRRRDTGTVTSSPSWTGSSSSPSPAASPASTCSTGQCFSHPHEFLDPNDVCCALFVRLNALFRQGVSQIFVLVVWISQWILILSLVQVSGELLVRSLSDILALAPEDVLSVDFVLLSYCPMKVVPELNIETEVDL